MCPKLIDLDSQHHCDNLKHKSGNGAVYKPLMDFVNVDM